MARVAEPLMSMGANIETATGDRPPLVVRGRRPLRALDWTTAVPSAQVKSAILLAGLAADGPTRVREAVHTRDHTERMLAARGVAVRTTHADSPGAGALIELDGPATVDAGDEAVPGDVSAAAFWLVAAACHPDAELRLRGVGLNPTRRAVIDLLRAMGADIEEHATRAGPGEPMGDLVVRSSSLRGIDIGPGQVAAAIDEIPVLCLAAALARGRTTIRGAGELRVKESDRLAGIAAGLTALGGHVSLAGDDVTIDGPARLVGAATDSLADHRLAMTFAVAGLLASGATTIERPSSADISYPGFFDDLERIRA
jgi:3-phosphoshikimate 1-carboxyvinyltransferase